MDKNDVYDPIPESLRKSMEIAGKLQDNVAPFLEQQEKMQKILDQAATQKIESYLPALDAVHEIADNRAIQMASSIGAVIEAVYDNSSVRALGELAMKTAIPTYQFESPVLKEIDAWGNSAVANLATGLTTLINNPVMQELQAISSKLGMWLQTIDFSPLTDILENIQDIGFDCDYEEVNEVVLKAMFDARWFPYAGWIADYATIDAVLKILNTSRASKNRVNRIDSLIFSYYNKEEINNFKRRWRKMNLPPYMIRILVQSVQAYHRREYALTVSALSTLWEGIIQEKVNDGSYRVSRKTRQNLTKLIEENEFDRVFSSFCEEFIFYNCTKPEDVKPDVPGRHGIAHCWYDTYPSRKMALNAILFTDFLLGLTPLEKTEDDL